MKKIAIVVNKNWEVEPVLATLFGNEFRPAELPFPQLLSASQESRYTNMAPRATSSLQAKINTDSDLELRVDIWCIQDLMDKRESGSSSQEKFRVLQPLLQAERPDLVVAVGTAGFLADQSYSGCVVIGAHFFNFDGHPNNPKSGWTHPDIGHAIGPNINASLFSVFDRTFKRNVESKMITVPINPAVRSTVLASSFYTAISTCNVTDYGEYNWADREAIDAFRKLNRKLPIGSLETTHGLIRLCGSFPCIFVSGITDQEGHFELEVTPAQNYLACMNVGIVLAEFIIVITKRLADPNFSFLPEG